MLGNIIRIIREAKGYSQKEVADILAIPLSTYRRLEKGMNVGILYFEKVIIFFDIKFITF